MAGSKSSKKDKAHEKASASGRSTATGMTGRSTATGMTALTISTVGSRHANGEKKVRVQVPYGVAYTIAEQTKMTHDKVMFGLREVLDFMSVGNGMLADKTALDDHVTRLRKQGDKIMEALDKDAIYVEEVRHHHNRISDLCDDTRSYSQEMMLADLKRASHIRQQVLTIVQGKPPDYELDQDEQDDLKTVRNMLRRQFGGKKTPKEGGGGKLPLVGVADNEVIKAVAGDLPPSQFKARTEKGGDLFGTFQNNYAEETLRGDIQAAAHLQPGWAAELVSGAPSRK